MEAGKIESTNCPRWQLEDSFSWLPSLGQPRELLKPSLTTTTRSRFVLYCNRRLLRCTTILSASVVVFPPNKMRVAPPVDYRTGTHRARGRGESTLDSCQAVNPPLRMEGTRLAPSQGRISPRMRGSKKRKKAAESSDETGMAEHLEEASGPTQTWLNERMMVCVCIFSFSFFQTKTTEEDREDPIGVEAPLIQKRRSSQLQLLGRVLEDALELGVRPRGAALADDGEVRWGRSF